MSLVYEVPFWDAHQWNTFKEQDESVEKIVESGTKKIFSFNEFSEEVFHRLYSPYDAQPLEKTRPEAQWAVKFHNELTTNAEFQSLQSSVNGNYFLSGLAAATFIKECEDKIPHPTRELQNPHELRQTVLSLLRAKSDSALDKKLIAQIKEQGKEAVQEIEQWAARVETRQPAIVIRAVAAATNAVKEAGEMGYALGWGLGESDSANIPGGSIEDKLALAKRLASSTKLKAVMKIAGRIKRFAARKQAAKTNKARIAIASIETGADIPRVLPSEMLGLVEPSLEPGFIKRLSERSLLQYKLAGREKTIQGPIVFCVDGSSSMRGDKEIWAKALLMAMLSIAANENRDFMVIHFDGSVRREYEFPAGKQDYKKLLDTIEYFPGDNKTNWQRPLSKAVEYVKRQKNYKNADIILLTDGECAVSQTWLNEFKQDRNELGFTLYSIMIGTDAYKSRLLPLVTDEAHITTLIDLSNDELISNVLSI